MLEARFLSLLATNKKAQHFETPGCHLGTVRRCILRMQPDVEDNSTQEETTSVRGGLWADYHAASGSHPTSGLTVTWGSRFPHFYARLCFGSEESVTRVGKQCRVEYTEWLQVTAPNPGHLGSFPASTLWSLCGLGKITQPLSASVSALRRNNNNRYYLIKFQRG